MANEFTLQARLRNADEHGSRAVGRLRRAGEVPATMYGAQHTDAKSVAVDAHELYRALKTDAGLNVLLRLELADGESLLALPREVRRNPIKDDVLHLDFLLVSADQKVPADIPLELTGESHGVKLGGVLQQQLNTLAVLAPVSAIPQSIEVDVTNLGVSESFPVGNLDVPAGVEVVTEAETVIAVVVPTSATRMAAAAAESAAAGKEG